MASFWDTVKDPFVLGGAGGLPGMQAGAGYDAATGQGLFDQSGPHSTNPYYQEDGTTSSNPYAGMPQYPTYHPGYDPSTMSLTPYVQSQLGQLGPLNTQGLDQFRTEATRTGPSAWAGLMQDQNDLRATDAKSSGSNAVASKNAETLSSLASSGGGLSAGARERAGKNAERNYFNMSQGVGQQHDANAMQIGVNDEQNRISQLGMLPGMEAQSYGAQLDPIKMMGQARQADITNQLGGNQNLNAFNMGAYQTQGQIWGAGKQADATANSGGSCWLITRLARQMKLPKDQAQLLTQFKKWCLGEHLEITRFYIRECKSVVEKMDEQGFDWSGFQWFNQALVSQLRGGDVKGAYNLFKTTLAQLIEAYWPECDSLQGRALLAGLNAGRSTMEQAQLPDLNQSDKALGARCLQNLSPEQFAQGGI